MQTTPKLRSHISLSVDTKSTRATKYVSGAKITGLIPLTVEKIDGDNSF